VDAANESFFKTLVKRVAYLIGLWIWLPTWVGGFHPPFLFFLEKKRNSGRMTSVNEESVGDTSHSFYWTRSFHPSSEEEI